MAVAAAGLPVFWEIDGLGWVDVFRLDFINKGYRLNDYILYFMRLVQEINSILLNNIRQKPQSGYGRSSGPTGLQYDDVQSYEPALRS